MPFYALNGKSPRIHPRAAYISEQAIIIGEVIVGEACSIFDNVVIEGDVASVTIGARVNIQSQSVVHTLADSPTWIGDRVTVGHRAVVHGARIEPNVTVGIGAIVGAYVEVGHGAVIGEGAVVKQRDRIPPLGLALGVPASVVRILGPEAEEAAVQIAEYYVEEGLRRARGLKRL